jgi:sarcosine oxidase
MARFDVAIVGLGAMGSAAAWQLARRGLRVVGFDRFHPPHQLGSSGGRTRIIREAYWESPFYVPIVRRAYELWSDLERRAGRRLLTTTGGLVIGRPEGPLVAGARASAGAHHVAVETLAPAEIRRRFSAFRPDDDHVGVFEPRAGVLQPEHCIAAMLGEATAAGAELRFEEPVEAWRPDRDGVTVRTRNGSWQADRLILAAGAWMASDLPGLALPLRVTRQPMFWVTPAAPERCVPGALPIWLWETGNGPVYYGFPDFGDGPKVARHHGGEAASADTLRRVVDAEESVAVGAFLAERIPPLAGPVRDAGVCMYTTTPDEHFILDRHPVHSGILVASPCSGHGFKFAPAIGETLADLAMDRAPRFDLTPFRLERFA